MFRNHTLSSLASLSPQALLRFKADKRIVARISPVDNVATELLIISDGDEGLFCAYNNIEFKAPVYAGDFIEAYGEITHIGNTSRKMKFEARKVAVPRPDISDSAADFLDEPIVVAIAEGTCVTPKKCQRKEP